MKYKKYAIYFLVGFFWAVLSMYSTVGFNVAGMSGDSELQNVFFFPAIVGKLVSTVISGCSFDCKDSAIEIPYVQDFLNNCLKDCHDLTNGILAYHAFRISTVIVAVMLTALLARIFEKLKAKPDKSDAALQKKLKL